MKQNGFAISFFGWRPSKLFEGSEKANLSLAIITSTNDKNIYSSTYYKWSSEERPELFKWLHYLKLNAQKHEFIVPKINSTTEKSIYSNLIK